MYLDFKDICLIIFKSLVWTIVICLFLGLCIFNYNLGVAFCNYMNIPKDLALTIMSPGIAIEVCIILFIFELVGLYFIIKFLRINKYIDNFCDFLY